MPSNGGKGAAPRQNVHSQKYREDWDLIFGIQRNKEDKDAKSKEEVYSK